jgi:hypothetical protein
MRGLEDWLLGWRDWREKEVETRTWGGVRINIDLKREGSKWSAMHVQEGDAVGCSVG